MTESEIALLGLDFGSTTSSALVATARVESDCVTGRRALADPEVTYRSDAVLTPFRGNAIDQRQLTGHLERWLAESQLRPDDVWAGGAIVERVIDSLLG